MKVTIHIGGMSCAHCTARVEKALNSIDGVSARADLEKGCAFAECPDGFDVQKLSEAVENLGFEIKSID